MKKILIPFILIWTAVSLQGQDFADISIEDLQKAILAKKVAIIDVNGQKSFQNGHIPGAINFSSQKQALKKLLPSNKNTLIVAYCGGIGFVGLMIPHIVRHVIGVTTLKLVIGSALIGGSFLIWVDIIARSALANAEIPIGIITSALGSLFFLFIMIRTRNTK